MYDYTVFATRTPVLCVVTLGAVEILRRLGNSGWDTCPSAAVERGYHYCDALDGFEGKHFDIAGFHPARDKGFATLSIMTDEKSVEDVLPGLSWELSVYVYDQGTKERPVNFDVRLPIDGLWDVAEACVGVQWLLTH